MAAKKSAWAPFPHPAKAFDLEGAKLAKAWPALHAGDAEPFPDEARAAALLKALPKAQQPKGLDAAGLAAALQDAWRAFHRGDFQQAFEAGQALGPAGASVAVKAMRSRWAVTARASRSRRRSSRASRARSAPRCRPRSSARPRTPRRTPRWRSTTARSSPRSAR
jgi:hypothetical protein